MLKEEWTAWKDMKDKWPSTLVDSRRVYEFTGGMVSTETITNADSQGLGPKQRIKMGTGVVGYSVDSLIEWLEGHSAILSVGAD